ncbi:MAG: MmcQ/YjbR family DNA-binding protein [Actinomycetes bacterium]
MVTAEDVRRVAGSLPRAEEHLIRDHVKFRVGRLVFVSIAPDERSMGFGFPKEERAALVASEPHKFHMPVASDERYNWVRVWLDAIDQQEMEELVVEAWRMVVPKRGGRRPPGSLTRSVRGSAGGRTPGTRCRPPPGGSGRPSAGGWRGSAAGATRPAR